jgi:hypothetical protein
LDEECKAADPTRDVREFLLKQLGKNALDALVNPFLISFQRQHQRIPTEKDALDWLVERGRCKSTVKVRQPSPELPKPVVAIPSRPSAKPCSLRAKMNLPPVESDDAFRRNLEDLPSFTRAFYSQERRYPTVDEALEWLHANGRYSGEWEDGESRRAKRVQQILDFLEVDFNPELLGKGSSVSLRLGRFSWWIRQHFGYMMTGKTTDIKRFDAKTMTAPSSTVSVPAKFVETFLTVAEFCTKTDPLSNKAVPTNRIKKIWAMVKNGSPWNQKYFQVVRDKLHRMGVISIFDRKHHIGKAWRWMIGDNFPEQSLGEQQQKLKEKSHLPRRPPVSLVEFLADIRSKNNNIHNTLYYDESQFSGNCPSDEQVRPPPWSTDHSSRQF